MKRVLCYGDSNTWGFVPILRERYPEDVRWTGVLAKELGPDYRVIEEGLGGRTTVFDDPFMEQRNGKRYLVPCLLSHAPLDLVVLMLGTNDLKKHLGTTARGAAEGASLLAGMIRNCTECGPSYGTDGRPPQILLVAPPRYGEHIAELVRGPAFWDHGPYAYAQSLKFAGEFERAASLLGLPFLDAGSIVEPSAKDGIHLEPEAHGALGVAVAAKVRQLLASTGAATD